MKEVTKKEFWDFIMHTTMCQSENFWPKSAEQCSQVWGLCEYFPLCKFDDPAMVNALYKPAPVKK